MAENPITVPLPADLPTNWVYGQTVGPDGSDVGLSQQHGYNYLMEQVNAAQQAAEELGDAFSGLASLDGTGKVPADELPDLDYDPAGSAEKVQDNLDTHIADKENPHEVTAEQVPYDNSRTELESDTAQGAIDELYARMYGDLKVQVQVYETGTTTPISGVIVTGVVSETGGVCYANEDGIAIGYILSDAESATATVKVGTDYIDLTGQTSQQVTVNKGVTANATIYATRVSNPSGKIETFTSSTQKMFTDKVNRVDVHAVGAGGGGNSGQYTTSGKNEYARGGRGGKQGYSSYKNAVLFTPNELFSITIGKGGDGGKNSQGSSGSDGPYNAGSTGGASSCLGVTGSGGGGGQGANGGIRWYDGRQEEFFSQDADIADSRTEHQFGETNLPVVPGGDGGGGGAEWGGFNVTGSVGGDPNGGDGGNYNESGDHASTAGGGGGGGCDEYYGRYGGDGGNGIVYVRWFYE